MYDDRIDQIIDKYGTEKGILIQLLLDIQREFNWIPKEAIKRISERLKIPYSQIFRVASFYAALSLKPIGRHLIQVCLGTACHVRGGAKILDAVENELKIKDMKGIGVRYRQLLITQIDERRFSERPSAEILQKPPVEGSVSLDFFEHQVLQRVSKNRVSVPKDLPHPPPGGGWGTLLNGTEIRSVD